MIAAANGKPKFLVDQHGRRLATSRQRFDLAQIKPKAAVRAEYDAARTTDDFKNYWANADSYDADSANSRSVRETLVPRSRYEIWNNGYADGIAQTYATDLVGCGPTLRMKSGSTGFNQLVERWWMSWAKAVKLRRKLWCMAHAKYSDGESFAVIRRNPRVDHPVRIDLVLYETEQCQTPFLPFAEPGRIDGIQFDEFGNPEFYDILRQHPGATNAVDFNLNPERVPAAAVLHWFKLRRPGQHRGIPENASVLNCGAASRRFREATLAAAETAADFAVLLKTGLQPDELDPVTPMSSFDIKTRMMTAMPWGWEPSQLKAEHPNAEYQAFLRAHVSEMGRPKSMPYNKAAADSSDYNYASGRLDHQTYYSGLDVEREDANDLVLDQLFNRWFDLAVVALGWLGGDPEAINRMTREHSWDWPRYPVADIEAEANSRDKRLRNGTLTLEAAYAEDGKDFDDALERMAANYGVTVDEMREILRSTIFTRLFGSTFFPLGEIEQLQQQQPSQLQNADTATQ